MAENVELKLDTERPEFIRAGRVWVFDGVGVFFTRGTDYGAIVTPVGNGFSVHWKTQILRNGEVNQLLEEGSFLWPFGAFDHCANRLRELSYTPEAGGLNEND